MFFFLPCFCCCCCSSFPDALPLNEIFRAEFSFALWKWLQINWTLKYILQLKMEVKSDKSRKWRRRWTTCSRQYREKVIVLSHLKIWKAATIPPNYLQMKMDFWSVRRLGRFNIIETTVWESLIHCVLEYWNGHYKSQAVQENEVSILQENYSMSENKWHADASHWINVIRIQRQKNEPTRWIENLKYGNEKWK